jgi:site-specific recombinase XerD
MSTNPLHFQSVLAKNIQDFLCCHRALGKRFNSEESSLRLLDKYIVKQEVASIADINGVLLNAFMMSRPRSARSYNLLLNILNRFFDWMVAQQILVSSPLNGKPQRKVEHYIPFIFDPSQIKNLLSAARELPNYATERRSDIYPMIFMLMYCLGLRVSEASGLCRKDINMEDHYLIIRETKFSKNRLVPFGPKFGQQLYGYLGKNDKLQRDQLIFSFSKDHRTPIKRQSISRTFQKLLIALDLKLPPSVHRVRLHCLRHSFAVGTLLRWYREGQDPSRNLIYLSTFLGHINPASTAVYLTITGELLSEANQRYRLFAAPILEDITS